VQYKTIVFSPTGYVQLAIRVFRADGDACSIDVARERVSRSQRLPACSALPSHCL
jgi:hypothetical protein